MKMKMNGWESLAAGALSSGITEGGNVGPMSPGGGGGGAPMLETRTTISPTFQQSFTPQVSPVIQVSQGGGEQRGAATQRVSESQVARGGGMDEGAFPTGAPGTEISPSFFDSPAPSMFDQTEDRVFQTTGFNVWPWAFGLTAVGVVLYALANQPKKQAAI